MTHVRLCQQQHGVARPVPLELHAVCLEEGLVGDHLVVFEVWIQIHLGEARTALGSGHVRHHVDCLGGAVGHAVVGHFCHVDLVGDGLEGVVLVELDLVVDHPGADLLVAAPLWTPARHLLLEKALNLLAGVGVPQVKVRLGLLPLDDGVLLPGGQEGASRGPGETANLQSVAVM